MDKILLFIPMFNCEKQISRVLDQIDKNILKYVSEVIVVNNKSTDHGEEVVIDYCKQHPELPIKLFRNNDNYGLGGSHKVAFQYAIKYEYDYVIILHGDDQGRIKDFLPLLRNGEYRKYDCSLGARFMKGSKLIGYSRIRILGNYGFNMLFSVVVHSSIKDLGSGLNLYKVSTLKDEYYMKYPDTLYFNDLMILASCYYKQKILFYPISWREEDQISNNKLWKFSCSLLKMLWNYVKNKDKYLQQDMRINHIKEYTAQLIWDNQNGGLRK